MANWRSLFANAPTHSLDFYPPELHGGVPVVMSPDEVFEEGAADWKHSLVAQFLGKPPHLSLMHRILSKLWEKQGTLKIILAGSNLFLFQFENEIVCNWILENGPWHIQHNTMILHKWEPNLGPISFDLDKLPIWFHLHRVPLELYNKKGINYISSAIGTPYMDSITAARKRLTYAKVCIEVSASIDPPVSVKVKLKNGTEVMIPISIPWKPLVCKTCSLFGHSDQNCAKVKVKTNQVWKPKDSPSETTAEVQSIPDPEVIKDNAINEGHFEIVKSRGSIGKRAKSVEQDAYRSRRIDSSGHKIDSCGPNGKQTGSSSKQFIASNQELAMTNKYNALYEDALEDTFEEDVRAKPFDMKLYAGKKKDQDTAVKGPKSNQKLIGSSKHKLEMLCNDDSTGGDEEIDDLNDIPQLTLVLFGQNLLRMPTLSHQKSRELQHWELLKSYWI